jgi:hypothetical protein
MKKFVRPMSNKTLYAALNEPQKVERETQEKMTRQGHNNMTLAQPNACNQDP